MTTKSRTLLTVSQFSEKHPAWTQASLRNLIFYSQPRESSLGAVPGNGLDSAIRRIGRKILIDEDKFFIWLDSQNGHAA